MVSHSKVLVKIVQTANKFNSSVVLKCNNKFIDAKSLLGLYITLAYSSEYELHVHGPDEDEAKREIIEIFEKYNLQFKVVE